MKFDWAKQEFVKENSYKRLLPLYWILRIALLIGIILLLIWIADVGYLCTDVIGGVCI